MRVTSQTLPSSLMSNLQRLAKQQYQLQNEAATGKKTVGLEKESGVVQKLITLRTDASSLEQYQNNAESAHQKAQDNITTIRSLKTLSSRATEIAVKADPMIGSDGLTNYATEVNQLLEEALALANKQTPAGYAFAGTRSGELPFVAIRDGNGMITGVNYQGNQSAPSIDIAPESEITSSVIGSNDTNAGPPGLLLDSRSGADIFGHLISLRDHLKDGDINAVQQTDIQALETDEDNFLFHLSAAGSLQSRIELTQTSLNDQEFSNAAENAQITEVDLAETLVSLNQAQTAYQAALQSGAQMLRSSLMDYLR